MIPEGLTMSGNQRQAADYVARLERVAALAAAFMEVAYDDGPEEIALAQALKELEDSSPEVISWTEIGGAFIEISPAQNDESL